MASETRTATDHEGIRRWVEERGGKPATVRGTADGDGAGVLRIDFPGATRQESLEQISWDEWFRKFEENGLAFVYQERKASGEDSTFTGFGKVGLCTLTDSVMYFDDFRVYPK